jgi:hypothetical protein
MLPAGLATLAIFLLQPGESLDAAGTTYYTGYKFNTDTEDGMEVTRYNFAPFLGSTNASTPSYLRLRSSSHALNVDGKNNTSFLQNRLAPLKSCVPKMIVCNHIFCYQ